VALIKSLLSKWYMLPSFCLCLCVCVCFVCPYPCDYINICLWAVEVLKMQLLLLLLLLMMMFNGVIFFIIFLNNEIVQNVTVRLQ
jgi:hypothetical protein